MAAVYLLFIQPWIRSGKVDYSYTELTRGDIESAVSSTGTLEAINTIQVGTQISGTIEKIYVDYNDNVVAGQLLARIDTRLLEASVANASANVGVLTARLRQAEEEYRRNSVLYDRNVITEKEFRDSEHMFRQTLSNEKAARASLRSAEVNLGYAYIRSPIAGTVTERGVEEGQTVAASFATPTLFVIAEDLTNMQILADVDESDIGYIIEGMKVRFTVQSYPEKRFEGTVSQIRLQPVRINNVVNYKVVVQVRNEEGLLLPGMTASLDFISAEAPGVLLLNNSALRFRPDEAMYRKVKHLLLRKAGELPDSVRQPFLEAVGTEERFVSGDFRRVLQPGLNIVFYERGKQTDCAFIEVGISTGLQSEVRSFLRAASLPEGTEIINGIKSAEP